ncbi:NAD(P)/FAD-dependent oxidoreductase [Verrucomicrobiaceae bacterium R5-34]|uniref:NAD(P)/FAD-dependent oxidoreductase n=1 Tax=Oceaniferula flava TaxID=2800421 RepID=A0AAE2SA12_9BACT|nr:FAD/NAD(P)-binding oxidoreductase [Oceaniferula flavus]MBK1829458.1 NAD(P)/FAD-dependent oxidoreductase [Verrucomicrobiaceae bacterium R5-34]MBK1853684.1 NAD(P)/FAD-dependent oxidoreductase [Oceaniferula flavus]MBM1134990.1 NAD(P)/FAD-dependent oxidoreductase [Oceaniferula flavus]
MKPIIIIGNGIAGVTAAREIRKRHLEIPILIISGETDHHFSRTALMYIFMGHMHYKDTKPYEDHFWRENKLELKRAWVKKIEHEANRIVLQDGDALEYSDLILAVGSTPNKFGWPGQDLPGAQGLYSKQDLDQLEAHAEGARHAVIVGGGLIGIEMAEMLITRGIGVTFLVRENVFWGAVLPEEEAKMIEQHIHEHHVDLRMQDELDSIHAGDDGKVSHIITKSGEKIDCSIVGLTAGVRPNIDWLKEGSEVELDRGILVNNYFRTNLPNVWSIGDCAQLRTPPAGRRPIEAVWYVGKMQGTFVAANILGDELEYDPGIWWNSAKFFDIEYQTYGTVMPTPQEGEKSFFWKAPGKHITLRINYREDSLAVTGVNVFGIRHRHQVWEHWIREKVAITEVLRQLAAANFDPEFFTQYEDQIIAQWNQQSEIQVSKQLEKGLFSSMLAKLNLFKSH